MKKRLVGILGIIGFFMAGPSWGQSPITMEELVGIWEIRDGSGFQGSFNWDAFSEESGPYIEVRGISKIIYTQFEFDSKGNCTQRKSPMITVTTPFRLGKQIEYGMQELFIGMDTNIIFRIAPDVFGLLQLLQSEKNEQDRPIEGKQFLLLTKK